MTYVLGMTVVACAVGIWLSGKVARHEPTRDPRADYTISALRTLREAMLDVYAKTGKYPGDHAELIAAMRSGELAQPAHGDPSRPYRGPSLYIRNAKINDGFGHPLHVLVGRPHGFEIRSDGADGVDDGGGNDDLVADANGAYCPGDTREGIRPTTSRPVRTGPADAWEAVFREADGGRGTSERRNGR